METYWGTEVDPRILNLSTWWRWSTSRPGRFTSRKWAPGTQWISGWLGRSQCRCGHKRWRGEKKYQLLSGIELRSFCPNPSQYTDWPRKHPLLRANSACSSRLASAVPVHTLSICNTFLIYQFIVTLRNQNPTSKTDEENPRSTDPIYDTGCGLHTFTWETKWGIKSTSCTKQLNSKGQAGHIAWWECLITAQLNCGELHWEDAV
jgi:hypothetical protein